MQRAMIIVLLFVFVLGISFLYQDFSVRNIALDFAKEHVEDKDLIMKSEAALFKQSFVA